MNSDEEITSSEDEDDSAPRKQSQKPSVAPQLKRKADVKDIGEFLTKRHKDFEGFQNETIQKWHEKTKLSTGKQNTKVRLLESPLTPTPPPTIPLNFCCREKNAKVYFSYVFLSLKWCRNFSNF